MVEINVKGATLEQNEINEYIKYVKENNPKRKVNRIDITVDGEYVDLKSYLEPVPIERIRRITGYLVGTVDRFNNAKAAEERSRVKHEI